VVTGQEPAWTASIEKTRKSAWAYAWVGRGIDTSPVFDTPLKMNRIWRSAVEFAFEPTIPVVLVLNPFSRSLSSRSARSSRKYPIWVPPVWAFG